MSKPPVTNNLRPAGDDRKVLAATVIGALLLGFLWRARGSSGWGSSWGLLNTGFVFTLFLSAALGRRRSPSLLLTAVTAFSFMLTVPAWGTILKQITGVMTVENADGTLQQVTLDPMSGVAMIFLVGFGMAGLYGVLLGRCFSGRAWRLRDYLTVLLVLLAVEYIAKATVAHPIVSFLEPRAGRTMVSALRHAGVKTTAYATYMAHFNADSWAKRVAGGRNYFACVGAVASALAGGAAILTARFAVKDRAAAKIGLAVCTAFAAAITLADLVFLLPEDVIDAWPTWEYLTGFLAGGAITFCVLKFAPPEEKTDPYFIKFPKYAPPLREAETVFDGKLARLRTPAFFLLVCVGAVGLNFVRPVFDRLEDSPAALPATVAAAVAALAVCLVVCARFGRRWQKLPLAVVTPALCGAFTLYTGAVYLFVGDEPQIVALDRPYNALFTVSVLTAAAWAVWKTVRAKRAQREESRAVSD